MIHFDAPEWFLLAPVLLGVGWMWPRIGLARPLRVACLVLLVIAMAHPRIPMLGRGLDLWVLVDRSASAADPMAKQLDEWQSLLERAKGTDDRIFYVDYADVPVTRGEGTGAYSGDANQTRTALAVRHALAQMPPDRAARMLLLSDGFSTEPLSGVEERLRKQQVALDYRLVAQPEVADVEVKNLRMPARVQPGEPFLIEADLGGAPDGDVPYEIRRDGALAGKGTARLREGVAMVRLAEQTATPGAHRYELRIHPAQDSRSGNNSAARWIEVVGGPRMLLVTSYADDPLASVLRAQGFAVEVASPEKLTLGALAGAKAVLLDNVPAEASRPIFWPRSISTCACRAGDCSWRAVGRASARVVGSSRPSTNCCRSRWSCAPKCANSPSPWPSCSTAPAAWRRAFPREARKWTSPTKARRARWSCSGQWTLSP